jgi:hypothetical protein
MEPEAKKPKLDTDYISEQNNTEISKKKEAFTDVKTDKEISISSGADHEKTSQDTGNLKFVKEDDVGILCYISDLPGCHGVIKQRYF